jgi:hypothetical protein
MNTHHDHHPLNEKWISQAGDKFVHKPAPASRLTPKEMEIRKQIEKFEAEKHKLPQPRPAPRPKGK